MVSSTEPATARRDLPQGVVTFLFTDIAGSTQLLRRLGDEYGDVLSRHRYLLRQSFRAHAGREVDTQGDSFFVAFASPRDAVAAAVDAQRALAEQPWPHGVQLLVRMGVHTGEPLLVDGHYIGMDVHRAARIAGAAHGGQLVLSGRTADFVGDAPGMRLRDLGHHRLKDLEQPEHIVQVDVPGLADSFPPLRTEDAPTNLPSQVQSVVGRQRELQELRERLLHDDVRLLTITGPGGTGKTRVAITLAHTLIEDFLAGVYFVDLSPVEDEDLVAATIARSLDVNLEGDASAQDALAQHIGRRPMLLLLDNFEQVLGAGVVLSHLLSSCPELTVLVTSRLALSVRAEHEYFLPPLELARSNSLKDASHSEAVQLFVERASRVRPGFELTEDNAAAVAEICALVDGLPLAIELAAARTKLFPPQVLRQRLDDRLGMLTGGARDSPSRHQALRNTIDWSYDLLSPGERSFFRDLAVFSGGAQYDAIEAVVSPDSDVLDVLTGLVNHSLVRRREDQGSLRFRMLATLRDYADELLRDEPEHRTALRERHAEYFCSLVESDESRSAGGSLEHDQDNIAAALSFWLDERVDQNPEAGTKALRLATAQGTDWYHHGHAVEGIGWLERALDAAVDPPVELEAWALRMLGVLNEQRSRPEEAIALFERALAIYRSMNDRAGEASCLNGLGIALRSSRRPGAEEAMREAVTIREQLGDVGGLVNSRNNLGIVSLDQGKPEQALPIFTENLRADRSQGNDWGAACTLLNLGVTHLFLGDIAASRDSLREALTALVAVADHDTIAEALESSVGFAVALERWDVAARMAGAAEALRELVGIPCAAADRVYLDAWINRSREALGPEAFHVAWSEGTTMTEGQATGYVLSELLADTSATEVT